MRCCGPTPAAPNFSLGSTELETEGEVGSLGGRPGGFGGSGGGSQNGENPYEYPTPADAPGVPKPTPLDVEPPAPPNTLASPSTLWPSSAGLTSQVAVPWTGGPNPAPKLTPSEVVQQPPRPSPKLKLTLKKSPNPTDPLALKYNRPDGSMKFTGAFST